MQTTTLVERAIVTGLAALSLAAGGNLLAPAPADASNTYHELWRVDFRQRSGVGNYYRQKCASDAAASGYPSNYVSVGTSVDDPLENTMVCYGVRPVEEHTQSASVPVWTCNEGYEYRLAGPHDHVCVTHTTAVRTRQENSNPALHRSPTGGAYGPNTCASGYVWRDAFNGDGVCVSPAVRDQARADNSLNSSRGMWR